MNTLTYKSLGIDSGQEFTAYMREDCHVCKSEGFEALTRVRINHQNKSLIVNLNVIQSDILNHGEIAFSKSIVKKLKIIEGEKVSVSHMNPIESMSFVRSKIYGGELGLKEFEEIVSDITEGRFSNIELSAFLTSCAGNRLSDLEIIYLTKAMINAGEKIDWNEEIIVDKHCIGGLPGNRTTPIVVSILTACGLKMPKTSSRAITSPAGTADTMEVITNVSLSSNQIRDIVNKEGGCLAWGGTANLSPADDLIIRVEKALDIDSEGQLVASVLSKKLAAGSTHVILDFPIGPTAKIRKIEDAEKLKNVMEHVAEAIGLNIKVIFSDGTQPVGVGIGPTLEAIDVLKVLRNEADAPKDLKERALTLAGDLLDLSQKTNEGEGYVMAEEILTSGKAFAKFQAICEAQGRFSEPVKAELFHDIISEIEGTIQNVDNRKLARLAKLCGAPQNKEAGIEFFAPIGKQVLKGEILMRVYADSKGELEYALDYYHNQTEIIEIR